MLAKGASGGILLFAENVARAGGAAVRAWAENEVNGAKAAQSALRSPIKEIGTVIFWR